MKITVLIEDTTNSRLICEHGLSLLIEYRNRKYLLDAGSSPAFLCNAEKMGISTEEVETCFLSHGHYDHGGGFGEFVRRNPKARVYAMADVEKEYFSGSGEKMHYAGVPRDVLLELRKHFVLLDKITKPEEGIWLIPHSTPGLEAIGKKAGLFKKEGEHYTEDDFSHEMSVVFDTPRGLVIFNSCSHGGLQNILEEVQRALPDRKIYAFLGGLHMVGKRNGEEICTFSREEISALTEKIKEVGLTHLYTGHCTGRPAFEMLREHLQEELDLLYTGREIYL